MSTSVTTTPGAPPSPGGDGRGTEKSRTFGLPTATALVIGSVIALGVPALSAVA